MLNKLILLCIMYNYYNMYMLMPPKIFLLLASNYLCNLYIIHHVFIKFLLFYVTRIHLLLNISCGDSTFLCDLLLILNDTDSQILFKRDHNTRSPTHAMRVKTFKDGILYPPHYSS